MRIPSVIRVLEQTSSLRYTISLDVPLGPHAHTLVEEGAFTLVSRILDARGRELARSEIEFSVRNEGAIHDDYMRWHYASKTHERMKWLGVPIQKWPCDLWMYQQILFELKPTIVVEFGTLFGGSSAYFSDLLFLIHASDRLKLGHERPWKTSQTESTSDTSATEHLDNQFRVLSVDISKMVMVPDSFRRETFHLLADSTSESTAIAIREHQVAFPGATFAILDSNHSKPHVLQEMILLAPLLREGDYLVVEDSNIGGHPIALPVQEVSWWGGGGYGNGPWDAAREFQRRYPGVLIEDHNPKETCGASFSTDGFFRRSSVHFVK
jgi:cephalosporin hydroxylase